MKYILDNSVGRYFCHEKQNLPRKGFMNYIAVTSTELRDNAARMRATASSVQDELNRMLSGVQALANTWQGSASASFNTYYSEMNKSWSQVKQSLEGIASMLDQTATSYDETEAQLAGRFR